MASFSARLRAGVSRAGHAARRPSPSGDELGSVHATLKPRGLVETGGVVIAAWWVGDGPAPPPGAVVRRRPDPGDRWLAERVLP
ncbi:hypothetical protein ACPFP2_05540 [Micromonospora citrea]|uniref:hypothetical protein n=1 Tax=Micromonospora citrea TaxID=47855 RepID=UPI003C3B8CCA